MPVFFQSVLREQLFRRSFMVVWDDIRFFKPEEFNARDAEGQSIEGSGMQMNLDFVKKLDYLRAEIGQPIKINSGMRVPERNDQLTKAVEDSSHLSGHAVDISCVSSVDRYKLLDAIFGLKLFNRVGIYKTHIHVDDDPTKPASVVWVS